MGWLGGTNQSQVGKDAGNTQDQPSLIVRFARALKYSVTDFLSLVFRLLMMVVVFGLLVLAFRWLLSQQGVF